MVADYYVLRDMWVVVEKGVKYVVVDVWGFRADGTEPVTGFQTRIPYDQYLIMSEADLDTFIQAKAAENENVLETSFKEAEQSEAETRNFNTMYLGNGTQPTWTKTSSFGNLAGLIAGSAKLVASGYPRTNDTDPDNGGGGVDVVTWKFSWAKADFSATGINQAVISIPSATSTSPILTGFNMTPFDKTSNDTLTIFVNHTYEGV